MAAVLVRVHHHQAARICRRSRRQQDGQNTQRRPEGPRYTALEWYHRQHYPDNSQRTSQSNWPGSRVFGEQNRIKMRMCPGIHRRGEGNVHEKRIRCYDKSDSDIPLVHMIDGLNSADHSLLISHALAYFQLT